MKSIIIGGGSIGKRHAGNLNRLGVSTRIVDIDEIDNLKEILKDKYDLGFVCTPNIYHIPYCTLLAEYNIPIFCEKPFYTETDGLADLLGIVTKKDLITMVGCNLRFTPEVNKIPSNTKYISVYFGYDLRKWRPGTDHLKSYSANKNLGGGVFLDVIHELDYLCYKFGKVKDSTYITHKLTDVTVDTEDLVVGRIIFESGTIADFNLNYLSETYQRYYDVLEDNVLRRVHFEFEDKNTMYLDQTEYFVNHVKTNKPCMNSFIEAKQLLDYII